MQYRYDISFITINYNGLADTCELIDSIRQNVHEVTYEIIVVDNASRNNEVAILRNKYNVQKNVDNAIQILASSSNRGFAGGNNLAIPVSKGKYLFFINNDTIIEQDHLKSLIARMEDNSTIGIVCPKIIYSWAKSTLQYAGFTPLSSITLRNRAIGCGEQDFGQYNTARPTAYAHGAAMMVSREAIAKAKPMWEGYFLYYEEMDWSECIRRAGYEIWYDPAQTIYHKESKSVGIESPSKTYFLTRNRLLFARRNRKGPTRLLSYVYQTLVSLFIHMPRHLLRGKFSNGANILRALKDFYF